ncbi:RNA polymerase sigma factor [Flavobacteriaceae bacterium TP-CH-4]|uniref:RNA polymerase sigma factor n=1 Tax=Pelagihabitans pacificus TaxID=2696054 RepID=A0A967AUU5_9FLAO|nr:RNA polymerase sigma factor [Pelagihabitans pacificus]NHF58002.1 RNA polymerase sigma factor [Pelagihabitans pacificus]
MVRKTLEILVENANRGDKKSLERVIVGIKDMVYNLSLRMLLFPEDAEDATQEILVKIVTHLSMFRNQSKFKTWVYRIATNYLLTIKGKKNREFAMDFEAYGKLIDTGHSETIAYTQNKGEQRLLEEEVKISCTHGMLQCLNESGRLVYILGEILEFNSIEGGEILGITPENFRKQLSRARSKLRNFLQSKCGLANADNPCRCHRKIDHLISEKLVLPEKLRFAYQKKRSLDLMKTIDTLERSAAIFRSTPQFATPENVVRKIRETIHLL